MSIITFFVDFLLFNRIICFMINYEEFYKEYLGILPDQLEKDKMNIFSSPFRNKPICNNHYFPIIFTTWQNYQICSCSDELFSLISGLNDKDIETKVKSYYPEFEWREYKRFAFEKEGFDEVRAESLNQYNFHTYVKNKSLNTLSSFYRNLIFDNRFFIMFNELSITAQSYVSDIFCDSGNITVNTFERFRRKGFGREVVKASVNHCLKLQILPLYLVRIENIPSIRLAESLNFTFKSQEYCAYINK